MGYMVRKPTVKEREELKNYVYIEMFNEQEYETVDQTVNNAHIGIIEDYISDSPGYVGKLLFVVWGFSGAYELYGWDKEKRLYKIDKEI